MCPPTHKKTPLGGILTNVWVFQSKHFIIFVVCYLGSIPHWDRGKVTVSKVGIVTSNEPFGLNHLGICQQLLLEDMVNIPIIYRVYYTSQVVGLGISEPSTAVRKPMIVDLNPPFTYLFFFDCRELTSNSRFIEIPDPKNRNPSFLVVTRLLAWNEGSFGNGDASEPPSKRDPAFGWVTCIFDVWVGYTPEIQHRYQKKTYLKGHTFSNPSFWVSMLVFGGVGFF